MSAPVDAALLGDIPGNELIEELVATAPRCSAGARLARRDDDLGGPVDDGTGIGLPDASDGGVGRARAVRVRHRRPRGASTDLRRNLSIVAAGRREHALLT